MGDLNPIFGHYAFTTTAKRGGAVLYAGIRLVSFTASGVGLIASLSVRLQSEPIHLCATSRGRPRAGRLSPTSGFH